MTAPICPYCNAVAKLVTGKVIYPHRPDLFRKKIWQCAPCDAIVGCHGTSDTPLGRLANAPLRHKKQAAHAAFDPIWKSGARKRGGAYGWLADQLGIAHKDCHIGEFDEATCERVVQIVRAEFKKPPELRFPRPEDNTRSNP